MDKKNNLRVAIAQVNCTVGDLKGNSAKICQYINKAKDLGVDIISFPELAITGYPPEDLLLKPKFIDDNLAKIRELSLSVGNIAAIVGFVDKQGGNIYNSAAIIYNGKICGVYRKKFLPNYGVFDEQRYFTQGDSPFVFKYGNCLFGVNICEDIWHKEGPISTQALSGVKLVFNINASPYHLGKIRQREEIASKQAKSNRVFLVYTNLVGGQDELVFDGRSMIVDNYGKIIVRAEAFKEDLLVADLDIPIAKIGKKPAKMTFLIAPKARINNIKLEPRKQVKLLSSEEEVYQALVLGLKDYVVKNGFQKVVIGLSGGIDSALVAVIAADALGKDNVHAVFMPSRYSSQESRDDAMKLAQNIGIKFITISIEKLYKAYLDTLKPHFLGTGQNITEENLQARIRGNILMALSNKFGWLVLTTGNKSEMSTGYATLYGDMAGGFALIKDLPKTLVYKLAEYRNSLFKIIPKRILTKEPTAELKHNQKDSDTLPAYSALDKILKAYVEEDKDLKDIISMGFDKKIVCDVLGMVDRSEYKRRQAPPGIKITPRAFGRDRRMPVTNHYKIC